MINPFFNVFYLLDKDFNSSYPALLKTEQEKVLPISLIFIKLMIIKRLF